MRYFIRLIGALALAPAALHAQLGSFNPRPGPQGTFAITHAHIVTVSGADIANGTVVISGGKITAVGASAAVPAGAKVIDAAGLMVYPGMMETSNSLGLAEITEGANATVDNAEVGQFNPNVHAFFGIDPHSAEIGVTRVVGITHVVSHPSGGILSGQAALMNLAGDTPPQMAVVRDVAMSLSLPGGGRGGRGGGGGGFGAAAPATTGRESPLDSLKALLQDAAAYARAWDAYNKDKSLPRPKHDVVLESLVPMIEGKMPAMIPAETATDMRAAVTFGEENKIKVILVGGRDAWRITDFLKQHDTPVIFTAVMALPSREDDPYDANYSAPAKLAAAGVRFAIASGEENPDLRNLPYVAGMAAAFGLSKEDAIKAVTLWPAQIFGVGDKLGSIQVGKMANLVVTDGNMLEAKTNTKYLFIDGRQVPLDTKHTALNAEFKDRP